MPATDSSFTTLLENLEATFTDSTNFSAVAAALTHSTKTSHVAPAFVPLMQATPYVVIVPGRKESTDNLGRRDTHQVELHLVHGVLSSPEHYYTVVGTAATEGILTLAEEIEQAVSRPEPFNHAPYNTAPYTALTNVHVGWCSGWSAVELAQLPLLEGLYAKQTLTIEYVIEKGL
jgi:hypothetical protein